MFFRKNRVVKAAAEADKRQKTVQQFRNRIEAAKACADPAQELLEIEDVKFLLNELSSETKSLENKASAEAMEPYGYVAILGTIGIWLSIMALSPWVLVAAPLTGAMLYFGAQRSESAREAYRKTSAPFLEQIRTLSSDAESAAEKIMSTDLEGFARSPKLSEALDKVPRVSRQFALALAKHIAGEATQTPSANKKPGASLTL